VPWDVAWELPVEERLAYSVIFGKYHSRRTFNWDLMRYNEDD
jgi:hypothetical protein